MDFDTATVNSRDDYGRLADYECRNCSFFLHYQNPKLLKVTTKNHHIYISLCFKYYQNKNATVAAHEAQYLHPEYQPPIAMSGHSTKNRLRHRSSTHSTELWCEATSKHDAENLVQRRECYKELVGYQYCDWHVFFSCWHHQIETESALLALRVGNSTVIGDFPSQMRRSFDVFFSLCLNKRLIKSSVPSFELYFVIIYDTAPHINTNVVLSTFGVKWDLC